MLREVSVRVRFLLLRQSEHFRCLGIKQRMRAARLADDLLQALGLLWLEETGQFHTASRNPQSNCPWGSLRPRRLEKSGYPAPLGIFSGSG